MTSVDMAEGQAVHPSPPSLDNDPPPGNEATDPLTTHILPWLPKLATGSIMQTISGQLAGDHGEEFRNFWSNMNPLIIRSGQVMLSGGGGGGQPGVQHIGRTVEVLENPSSFPTIRP